MAQHPLLQVTPAIMGVDQARVVRVETAVSIERLSRQRDRVDGQVAPRQVFLQAHAGIGVEGKAMVAACGLALGAGQRVFLARARMQEHREIASDRQEALRRHGLGRAADHHPVAVGMRAAVGQPVHGMEMAQQAVAHRAADQVDLPAGRLHAYFSRMRVERSTPSTESPWFTASSIEQAIRR
jgi:hypothetical protein